MEILNRVAIITGASSGIGLATAQGFASAGAKVVLAARSGDKLKMLADDLHRQGVEALPLVTDMRNSTEVKLMIDQAYERFGQIDLLVNNAGQAAAGTVAEMNPADFRHILELNVFGPLYAMQAVIPKMRQAGGGLIINISSMVSKMHIPGLSAYAATKAAFNLLSETARVELAQENIRVITVYPRMTATNFGRNSIGDQRTRQRQRASSENVVIDTPEYVAQKILEAARIEPAEQYMNS